jgi:hypothetical protein
MRWLCMKKRLFVLFASVTAILVVVGLWSSVPRWFRSNPGPTVKDTLLLANTGRYDDAAKNLNRAGNTQYRKHSENEQKRFWEVLTRKGTITTIHILSERPYDDWAAVKIAIYYADGWEITAEEVCVYEDGNWKLTLEKTTKAIIDELARRKKQDEEKVAAAAPQTLAQDFTEIEGTGVRLRLLPGCEWDKIAKLYTHPKWNVKIGADYWPGRSLQAEVALARIRWEKRGAKVADEVAVTVGDRKGMLLDIRATDEKGIPFRTFVLILGSDEECVSIFTGCPEIEAYLKVAKECLLSAQWQPKHGNIP